jgi:hypothetical protein
MLHWKIIIKRILRRIKYVFIIKEIMSWQFESCERCGHCFKLCWSVKDEIWKMVYGSDNGCLCIDCFVELANECGIKLKNKDFEAIDLFNP